MQSARAASVHRVERERSVVRDGFPGARALRGAIGERFEGFAEERAGAVEGATRPARAGTAAARSATTADAGSSACAEWKNVAAKFQAIVPPTTTSVRSSVLHTVAAARPTNRPVRCMIS